MIRGFSTLDEGQELPKAREERDISCTNVFYIVLYIFYMILYACHLDIDIYVSLYV